MAVVTVVAGVAAVAETATRPQDGTVNHRATIGGPSFLCALIQTTIPRFSDLLTAAMPVINRWQPSCR